MPTTSQPGSGQPVILIPQEVFDTAAETMGKFFEPISGTDPIIAARDFLETSKSFKRADIINRYHKLEGSKLLEVGSGFGTNLAVWMKHYNVDALGVEPGGEGFNHGYLASRILLTANGLDPERVINSTGESLPFPADTFDIVYSANVLEHTENPELCLSEALRVLRPGGVLHMEMPNYLSYFEGHYMVFQPPILWPSLLGWWVKNVFRRDPAFAATLRTRINPVWCRRQIREASLLYSLELVSVGEDLFLERLAQPFVFEMETVRSRMQGLIGMIRKVNVGNWLGHAIVALQGHYPIYLTVRKGPAKAAAQ